MSNEYNEDLDDFLEHFGVKGMRWGHRKATDDGGGASSGPTNRELNKASRAKDKAANQAVEAKRREEVIAARKRVYGKENLQNLKATKAQAKELKSTIGSREARKMVAEVRNKNYDDLLKSQEYLNGREFAKDLVFTAINPNLAVVAREIGLRRKYK